MSALKRFVVHLGPDTFVIRAKSEKSLKKRFNKLYLKRISPNRDDHLGFEFRGRKYCRAELRDVVILTTRAYLKILEQL